MYLGTPLAVVAILALASATSYGEHRKPTRLRFREGHKELMHSPKLEEPKPEEILKPEEDKKSLELHKMERGSIRHRWMGHGHKGPIGHRQPVVEEEYTVKRKYAPEPKPWEKFYPAPKVVAIPKPYWKTKLQPLTTPVPMEEPITILAPTDSPAKVTEAPVEVTEAPAVITEAPAVITEAPAEITEAPAEITEAPAEITEAPAEITEAPAEITEAPAEITEAPVEVTEAPVEVTEAPVEVTEAPVEVTEAPVEVTEAPVEVTEAPVEVTEAPVEVTEAPVEVTEAPVEVTEAPVEVTEAPVEVTEAPVEVTEAPVEVTEAPVEVTEAPAEFVTQISVENLAPSELTTQKYVLNEEAAEKYWATATFKSTQATTLKPLTEAPKPTVKIPEEEPGWVPEQDHVKEKPIDELPQVEATTMEYIPIEYNTVTPAKPVTEFAVVPEGELTTLSAPEPVTEQKQDVELAVPEPEKKPEIKEKQEKPSKKTLISKILEGKGLVVEKKEHKKYWIHKPLEHPKDIGQWHPAKSMKTIPCLEKMKEGKASDC